MVRDGYCPNCGEFMFRSLGHRCKPMWYVRLDWHEQGDERQTFARDAREAAELFSEQYDAHGDYSIIHAGEAKVIVFAADMTLSGMFEIRAESQPVYWASEVRLPFETSSD